MVIVYWAPGPVGLFIDEFILLMNELPIQHRILIVGDFTFDQMLPENIANIAPLKFDSKFWSVSVFTIYIWGNIGSCIWFFQFQYCFSSTFTPQWSLCSFSPNLWARDDLNLHCQDYPYKTAHYYNYGHFKCLMEIELVKNSENLNYFFFFSVYACCIAVH